MDEPIWHKKYEAIVFDLDDTLLNTTVQCVEPATLHSFKAMIEAGLKATIDDCKRERNLVLRTHSSQELFNHVAQKFGIRTDSALSLEEIVALGVKTYFQQPLPENLELYPTVKSILSDLGARYMIFLVTMGQVELQRQKVRKLKIGHFFRNVFFVDSNDKLSKLKAFGSILGTAGLKPKLALSVGNRLDLEIAQAKALGMDTCFVLTERHRSTPLTREEQPDYKINRISEIIKICQL